MYVHKERPRIGLASVIAGPTFVIATMLVTWMAAGANAIDVSAPGQALIILPILLMATLFGTILAIIPCAAGAWTMRWLGRGNVAMRLPAMWAIAGGSLGAAPAILYSGDQLFAFELAATGAVCALVCRHRMEWADDAPL